MGADVAFVDSEPSRHDFGLHVVEGLERIGDMVSRVENLPVVAPLKSDILEDIANILVNDILENCFYHSHTEKPIPHLFINDAVSSAERSASRGVISLFEEGEDYYEVCLGDLGKGIDRTLGDLLPRGYESPFKCSGKRKLTTREKILMYAFEFASTVHRNNQVCKTLHVIGGECA